MKDWIEVGSEVWRDAELRRRKKWGIIKKDLRKAKEPIWGQFLWFLAASISCQGKLCNNLFHYVVVSSKKKKKEKKSCYFTSLGSVSACCVSQQREEKGQSLNLARCLAGSQLEPSTQGSILPSLACPTTPPPRFTLTASRQGSRAHINSAHCHGGRLCQGKNVVLGDGVGRGSSEKK